MNFPPNLHTSADPIAPPLEPKIVETLSPALELEIALPPEIEPEIDPEDVVEEAELLLREGAPHDFDVLVIGGGPGGCAAALRAARGGLHVALVAEKLGGAWLSGGGLASKFLLAADKADLVALQARLAKLRAELEAQTRAELETAGVEIIDGRARFVEEHTLEIEFSGQMRRVMAVHVVIAVGGAPGKSEIPGADLAGVLSCDQILRQSGAPPRLVVVGAGVWGVEIASIFAGFGTLVTITEASQALLPIEDEEIEAAVQRALGRDGVTVETGVSVARIEAANDVSSVVFVRNGEEKQVEAEQVLLATPRVANVASLNLAAANIAVSGGKIEVEADFQTSTSSVYAIGDCIRKLGWVGQAQRDGHEVAGAILGLAGEPWSHFVPVCCFAAPGVASVGLTLRAALELGIAARACRAPLSSSVASKIGAAARLNEDSGFVKLVYDVESGRLIGCQIVGAGAVELIGQAAIMLRAEFDLEGIAALQGAYPSRGEAFVEAARAGLKEV